MSVHLAKSAIVVPHRMLGEKAERESHIVSAFCRAANDRYRSKHTVIPIPSALDAGLVVRVDGETVDGVLQTRKGRVAIELLGYAPLGDREDVSKRDYDLRCRIGEELVVELARRRVTLGLHYQEEWRKPPQRGRVKAVPRDLDGTVNELRSIVAALPDDHPDDIGFWRVYFKPAADIDMYVRMAQPGDFYLDAALHPICTSHFQFVKFFWVSRRSRPEVASDLSCGFVGFDSAWVSEHLRHKLDISITKSAKRANGDPLWLVIHSDGCGLNRYLPEQLRAAALEHCRAILRRHEHRFERAYWVDGTAYKDAAWVGRVF